METLDTVSRQKRVTRVVLVVLLVILVAMGACGIRYKDDYLFLILGLVHLLYAIDYLRSYGKAYATVTFLDKSMILRRGKASVTLDYANVEALTELRNGFLEIAGTGTKPVCVHSDIPPKTGTSDPQRTANAIRREIEARANKDIRVTYRNR